MEENLLEAAGPPTTTRPGMAEQALLTSPFHAPGSSQRVVRGGDTRRSNRALVLQCIYDQPDLSRAEVARRTGLTRAGISAIVADLVADGLVEETGRTATQIGKPATMLTVSEAQDIIALDLSAPDVLVGTVHSIRGLRVTSLSLPLNGETGGDAVDLICQLIDRLIDDCRHRVLGIGVGSPGTIDAHGMVLTSRSFGWDHLPLQYILAEHTGLPVAVINDANAAAVAEQAFAGGPGDMLRVQIALGVGAGLLLGGQVLVGKSAAAGEIGHLVVEYQGQKCTCGKRGCLETWASVPALARRVAADPTHRDAILTEGGRRLGMALVPAVAMLDIDDVVLGGPSNLINGAFARAAQDLINERVRSEFRDPVRLRPSTLGDEATMLGAVAMVLRTTLGVW